MDYTTCGLGLNGVFEGQNGPLNQAVTASFGRGRGPAEGGRGVDEEGGGEKAPPASNTGVLNTHKEPREVGIDYLAGTFKEVSLDVVLSLVSLNGDTFAGWEAMPRGSYNYHYGMVRGRVKVYHGGNADTVLVVLSGDAVRQLEAEGVIDRWTGPDGFAARLLAAGFRPTRVDGAADDHEGLLDPSVIEQAVRAGGCVGRFQTVQLRNNLDASTGYDCGFTAYFGSRESGAMVRIYDKAAEQKQDGEKVPDGHWMRCELELKKERARDFLSALSEEGAELGQVLAGRLWGFLDFRSPDSSDSNKSRWQTLPWWSSFLGEVEKVRWCGAKLNKTLEKAATWFLKQVAPTFALLHLADGFGPDFLSRACQSGEERLREWQVGALKGGPVLCGS